MRTSLYTSCLWSPSYFSCWSHKNETASEGKTVSNFRPQSVARKEMQWTGRSSNHRLPKTTTPALPLHRRLHKNYHEKLQFTSSIRLRRLREPHPTSRQQRVSCLGPPSYRHYPEVNTSMRLVESCTKSWSGPAGDPVGPTIFWVYADIIRGSKSNVWVPQHDGVTYGSPPPPLLC